MHYIWHVQVAGLYRSNDTEGDRGVASPLEVSEFIE